MAEHVIEASDVHISYRFVRGVSIKRQFASVLTRSARAPLVRRVEAIRGVSFAVTRGRTLGLIGPNGSGKTTLLKAIAGIFEPDAGTLTVRTDSVSLLTLGAGFQNDLSGVENVYLNGLLLGLSRRTLEERLEQILAFADIGDAVFNPLKTFSSGMRSRLAFAIAVHVDPEVLLIDELLGVGDEAFRKKSQARLEEMIRSHRTVVIVSHSMSTIKKMCDDALWLDAGRVVAQGPAAEIADRYLKST
jgi:ABC-type polysaccharide/polyol phosphate transport system ATPase subunit